jgi:hypothetical protein
LHHFIAAGVWEASPVETELLVQADRLVGGRDAVLVIDDTALPKKGTHSVGVAAQYASALGKTANCQTMVSLTLARGEVPVMLALRLFLPESWTSNQARLERVGVPADYRTARTKPEIALAEIDRAIAAGVRFGCVLADAGYGLSAIPPAASISFRTVGSRSSGAASRVLPSRAPGDEMPIQPRCGIPAGLDPFKVACFIPQSCAAASKELRDGTTGARRESLRWSLERIGALNQERRELAKN